jgi:hypothetical protein
LSKYVPASDCAPSGDEPVRMVKDVSRANIERR